MTDFIVDDEHGNVLDLDCRLTNPKLWREWMKLKGNGIANYPSGWFASEAFVRRDIEELKKDLDNPK